ncbi:MAG: hypothetical protein ACLFU8_04590 [Anaerolineales bacterium]
MSDDLRDAFGDDIFMESDEDDILIEEEGEAQNRTFLIAAGILGALLLCAIVAFAAWALVINPNMEAERLAIVQTNEAIAINGGVENGPPEIEGELLTEEPFVEAETATSTPEPSPTPTETPVIRPTGTPTPGATEGEGEEGEGEEDAEGGVGEAGEGEGETAQATPTRTPVATRTPRPTPTRVTGSGADTTPDTGLGELVLVMAAGLLVGLMVFVRRLRRA